MKKYSHKLPRDDLKKFAKDVAKKIVASDFKNNRVEDPKHISEKQVKKVKQFVKEFFDKAVEKKKHIDKKKAEKEKAQGANGVLGKDAGVNGKDPSPTKEDSDHEDLDMLSDNEDSGPLNVLSPLDVPATPSGESSDLKRKYEEASPGDDSESNKRLKEEESPGVDAMPPPPPPPPPAEGAPGDADGLVEDVDLTVEMGGHEREETEEEKELRQQEEDLMRENEEAMMMDMEGSLPKSEDANDTGLGEIMKNNLQAFHTNNIKMEPNTGYSAKEENAEDGMDLKPKLEQDERKDVLSH